MVLKAAYTIMRALAAPANPNNRQLTQLINAWAKHTERYIKREGHLENPVLKFNFESKQGVLPKPHWKIRTPDVVVQVKVHAFEQIGLAIVEIEQ